MRSWELKGEVNLVSLEQLILKVSFLFNWHFRFMVRNFRNSLNHRSAPVSQRSWVQIPYGPEYFQVLFNY